MKKKGSDIATCSNLQLRWPCPPHLFRTFQPFQGHTLEEWQHLRHRKTPKTRKLWQKLDLWIEASTGSTSVKHDGFLLANSAGSVPLCDRCKIYIYIYWCDVVIKMQSFAQKRSAHPLGRIMAALRFFSPHGCQLVSHSSRSSKHPNPCQPMGENKK